MGTVPQEPSLLSLSRVLRFAARLLLHLAIPALLIACGGLVPQSRQPTIVIVSPPSNTIVAANELVQVQFVAQNSGGVARVEMSTDGDTFELQNPTPSSPSFTGAFNWTPRSAGSHTLILRAFSSPGTASEPAGIVLIAAESTPGALLLPTAVSDIPTTTAFPTSTLPATGTSIPPTSVPTTAVPATAPATVMPPTLPPSPPPTAPPTHAAPNEAPIITSFFLNSPSVPAGSTVNASVIAKDPDNDALTFHWSVDAGPRVDLAGFVGSGQAALFQSPAVPSGVGTYTLRAFASDGRGGITSATRMVTVVVPSNLGSAGPDFYNTWAADGVTQDKLGFAVGTERVESANPANFVGAEEAFLKGYMFWFKEDYDGAARIYVIYNADHTWNAFLDTWKPGVDPDFQCTSSPTPPARGFGKVWCYQPGIADKVGIPAAPEVGEGEMTQKFEHGIIMRGLQNGTTYVLFDDGTWK